MTCPPRIIAQGRGHPTMTCKTQAKSQDRIGEPVPFERLWRSHSTAICTDWTAQHIRIATHYCRTHRFDAPVPPHKVSQRMQNTKKKSASKEEKKVNRNPQFHRAQIEPDSAAKRRRLRPSRARANFHRNRTSVYPKKNTMFCANRNSQIASMM